MNFTDRKLPTEASPTLHNIPMHTVKPFTILYAPAYVYLKKNSKFIAIKSPLDFFLPEDLEKMRDFESLFISKFMDTTAPYQAIGRQTRKLLLWQQEAEKDFSPSTPALTPYEMTDSILHILAPIWFSNLQIEPFYLSVFANELNAPIDSALLKSARDKDYEQYELAVFRSAWASFLALHLGYYDLGTLDKLRLSVFAGTIVNKKPYLKIPELDALMDYVEATIPDSTLQSLSAETFLAPSPNSPLEQKLQSRILRIRDSLNKIEEPAPSVFGEKGFIHG